MKNRQPRIWRQLPSTLRKRLHDRKRNRMIPTQQNRPLPGLDQRAHVILDPREYLLRTRMPRFSPVLGEVRIFPDSIECSTLGDFQIPSVVKDPRRAQIHSQLGPHVGRIATQCGSNPRRSIRCPSQIRRLPVKRNPQKCRYARVTIHKRCFFRAQPVRTRRQLSDRLSVAQHEFKTPTAISR